MVDFPPLPTICVPRTPTPERPRRVLMSSKFASLFGVEQADIDQMNSPGGVAREVHHTPRLSLVPSTGMVISWRQCSIQTNPSRVGISSMAMKRRCGWTTISARIIASSVSSIGPDPGQIQQRKRPSRFHQPVNPYYA